MMLARWVAAGVALAATLTLGIARATETDQFTLPPRPLDDLGRDVGGLVLDIVRAEVAQLNERIAERRLRDPRADLEARDKRMFATHVYEQTGVGVPEATMERIVRYGDYGNRNVRFAPSYFDTIYKWVASPYPLSHITTNCPTVRLYGIDMGTDKLGHIFQTGYEYYTFYEDARAFGADEEKGIGRAISWGVLTEKGLYGISLTGVYSNGDLAGNYAGFKFYRNLFHEVRIGEVTLSPIVRSDGSRFIVDPARDNADLLRPFITMHLNEALNPSRHLFSVERIRGYVRDRCASWSKQVPEFSEDWYRAQLEQTKTFFGEPYGWDLPDDDAANLLECFRPDNG